MMITIIVASAIGFFMGILSHIRKNEGYLQLPKINENGWNPGFLIDGTFGAIASLVIVIVANPNEMDRIILLSILAGYLGEIVIDQMANKMIFEDKYKEIKDTHKELDEELNESPTSLNELKKKDENSK